MSRSAQDVLEFDKLRELLRLRTTCAPGRRMIDGLEGEHEPRALEGAFALITEAREWLRFGARAGIWRAGGSRRMAGTAESARNCAGAGGISGRRVACWKPRGWLKQQFREDADKFPLLAARCASLGDFRGLCRPRSGDACVLPNGEISATTRPSTIAGGFDRASIPADAATTIQKTLRQILRSRQGG